MKVKRFFAQSMAEALRQVRDQMGPDAVILSNRRVDGGVEIVTALDYDENMARQRLGDAAREATNGSRLAEMQAEQHRRLEDELGRSRDRIREVREKRATYGNAVAVAGGDFGHAGLSKESLADDDMVVEEPTAASAAYSGELAQMRAEISSLRDLVSARNGGEPEQTAVMTWWLKSLPLPALPIPENWRKCVRRSVPFVTWSVPGMAVNPNKQR